MAMIDKRANPNSSAEAHPPIEYLTENDFSIIRLCDIDESNSTDGTTHHFLVRDPNGYELQITVGIASDAIEEIGRRYGAHISASGAYWVACAERHLATYLCENDDYPPDAHLKVERLTLADIALGREWNGDPGPVVRDITLRKMFLTNPSGHAS